MSMMLLEETFITVINRQAMAFITQECKKAWPFGGLLKDCMTVQGRKKNPRMVKWKRIKCVLVYFIPWILKYIAEPWDYELKD